MIHQNTFLLQMYQIIALFTTTRVNWNIQRVFKRRRTCLLSLESREMWTLTSSPVLGVSSKRCRLECINSLSFLNGLIKKHWNMHWPLYFNAKHIHDIEEGIALRQNKVDIFLIRCIILWSNILLCIEITIILLYIFWYLWILFSIGH